MKNQYNEDSSLKNTKDALKYKVQEDFEQYRLSDEFFEKLHDEIMEKVAQVEIESEALSARDDLQRNLISVQSEGE
jgi:hypothetical protein